MSVLATSCTSGPAAPTRRADERAAPIVSSFGVVEVEHATVASVLTSCLGGSGDPACFSSSRASARNVVSAAAVGAPLGLVASVSGSTVTLSWSAPLLSPVSSYVLEAGSAPGLANLANFSTGTVATSYVATGVGAGSYFVRVRAVGSTGEVSSPSNEVVVVVGGGPCAVPGPPSSLSVVSIASGTVVLSWAAGSGNPTSYVLEAGSGPGLTNLAITDLGSPATQLRVTNIGPGTYYVRIRSRNACGASGPSNEVVFTIGSSNPTPPPGSSFGPGHYLVGRDIPAGRYYSVANYGCYWERQSGLGGRLSDVITNDFVGYNTNQYIVDILSSDLAFMTDPDCGTWFTTPRRGFQSNVPPGVWLVNVQLSPGIYLANAQYGCYWERRRDFTNSLAGIIANKFVSSAGAALVSVPASDVGFATDADCGVWARISATTTDSADGVQSTDDIRRQREAARSRNAGLP